jgi:hypothetical protein
VATKYKKYKCRELSRNSLTKQAGSSNNSCLLQQKSQGRAENLIPRAATLFCLKCVIFKNKNRTKGNKKLWVIFRNKSYQEIILEEIYRLH